MIVLWNTIYMEAVLEQLRKEGYPVNEEDKARLSPLIHEHINTQGLHSFVMPEAVVKGELRPLRNPADIRTEAITVSDPRHNRETYVLRSPYRSGLPGFPSLWNGHRYGM